MKLTIESYSSLNSKYNPRIVRTYYHKIKEVLNKPNKVVRNLIAINETKLKVGNKTIYLQLVIDVESKEYLGVYISEARSNLNAILFVRSILRFCSNKPKILVDGGA